MRHPNDKVGTIASYASELGYKFRVGLGRNGTRYIGIEGLNVTIPCWDGTDVFPARNTRRISNADGNTPEDGPAWVNVEEYFREVVDNVDSTLTVEPLVEQGEDGGVEYFDGIRVKGLLYVAEDDFRLKEFNETIESVHSVSERVFHDILQEYEIDLSEEGSGEQEIQEPNPRGFN